MNQGIIIKSSVVVALLVFGFVSNYGFVSAIATGSKEAKQSKLSTQYQIAVDQYSQSIKDSLEKFTVLRGSNNFSDPNYVIDSISKVEGCVLTNQAVGSYDDHNESSMKLVPEVTEESLKGVQAVGATLTCKNVESSAKILDGYKFLYSTFLIDFTKNTISLVIDLRGVKS
jgi:hypothetical protein